MNCTTKLMIEKYALKRLKIDFMGYEFDKINELSFHHLIVPRKDCKKYGIGSGYCEWNGAILVQETSHEYLHIIGNYDYEIFSRITDAMIQENIKQRIDIQELRRINDYLNYFEAEHKDTLNKKGYPIIREGYTKRLLKRRWE